MRSLSGSVSGSVTGSSLSGSSSSAFGSGRKNSVREALFGVFFILIKNQKKQPLIVYISYVIDYALLLAFNFRPEFPWSLSAKQYLSLISGSIQVRVSVFVGDYQSALTVWVIVTTFLAFCLGVAAYVARGFQTNRFRYVWPIQFLSAVVSVLVTVLLVPILNVYLTFLNCTYVGVSLPTVDAFPNRACWDFSSGGNGAIAAVSVLLIAIMLALSFCAVLLKPSSDPTQRFPGEGPSQKFEATLMAARTIVTILGTLISRRTTVLSWISLAINSLVFMLLLVWLPYYSVTTNRVRTGMFASLAWASLCLVVCVSQNNENSDGVLIALFVGLPFSAALGVFLACRRLAKVNGQKMVETTRTPVLRSSLSASADRLSEMTVDDGPPRAVGQPKGVMFTQHAQSSGLPLARKSSLKMSNQLSPPVISVTQSDTTDRPSLASRMKQALLRVTRKNSEHNLGNGNFPGGDSARQPPMKLSFKFQGKFNTEVDVELSTRFVLSAKGSGVEWDEKVGIANCLWEAGTKNFPDSVYVLLGYSNFLRHVMKNDSAADAIYAKLTVMSLPFWARFVLFCFNKDVESRRQAQSYAGVGGTMDVASLVEFQKLYRSAQRYHWEAILAMKRLWRSLLTNQANVGMSDSDFDGLAAAAGSVTPTTAAASSAGRFESNKKKEKQAKRLTLANIASSLADIYDASSRASRHYKMLLSKYSQAPRLLRAYAAFVNDCYNDVESTQELLRQAEALEEPEVKSRSKEMDGKATSSGGESEANVGGADEGETGSDYGAIVSENNSEEENGSKPQSQTSVILSQQPPPVPLYDTLVLLPPSTPSLSPASFLISQFILGSSPEHGLSSAGSESGNPKDQQSFDQILIGRKLSEFLFLEGIPHLEKYFSPTTAESPSGNFIAATIPQAKEDGTILIPSLAIHVSVHLREGQLSLTMKPLQNRAPIGTIRTTPTGSLLSFDESIAAKGLVLPHSDQWTLAHPVRFPEDPQSFFPFWVQTFEQETIARSQFVIYEFHSIGVGSGESGAESEAAAECVIVISESETAKFRKLSERNLTLLQKESPHKKGNVVRTAPAPAPKKSKKKAKHTPAGAPSGGSSDGGSYYGKHQRRSSAMSASGASGVGSSRGSSRRSRRKKKQMAEMIDIRKRSGVWHLNRKIKISLLVAVLFIIGTAISIDQLTNGAFLNIEAEDLGGDIPARTSQVIHEVRTVNLHLMNHSEATDLKMSDAKSYLMTLAETFEEILGNVYSAPAAKSYAPITDFFSLRTIYGICPDGVLWTPESPKYYSIECSHNFPSLAQKFQSETRDTAAVDWSQVEAVEITAHFEWLSNYGPIRIFDEFAKLPELFEGSVWYFMRQMKSIQAGVQSACIAIMILLTMAVLGPSLKRTLEDRLEALRIFKMIPPDVAERLLSRSYMFSLKELNGDDDDSSSDTSSEETPGDPQQNPEDSQPPSRADSPRPIVPVPISISIPTIPRNYPPLPPAPPPPLGGISDHHILVNLDNKAHSHPDLTRLEERGEISHPATHASGHYAYYPHLHQHHNGGHGGGGGDHPHVDEQGVYHQDWANHPIPYPPSEHHQSYYPNQDPDHHSQFSPVIYQSDESSGEQHHPAVSGEWELPPALTPIPINSGDHHGGVVQIAMPIGDHCNPAVGESEFLEQTPRSLVTAKSVKFSFRRAFSYDDSAKKKKEVHDDDHSHEDESGFQLLRRIRSALGLDLSPDEKAAKKEEKEVKESPSILVQRRAYEMIVVIIVGLLVIGIVLTSNTADSSSYSAAALSVGNLRTAHVAAARYFLREFALYGEHDTRTRLLSHTMTALRYHFALLEGSDELSLQRPDWKDLGDPQQALLYGRGCLLTSDQLAIMDCPVEGAEEYDILTSGLSTVLLAFVADVTECIGMGDRNDTHILASTAFDFAHNDAWPHLLGGLGSSCDIYKTSAVETLQKNLVTQEILVTVIILMIFFLYYVPFRKILAHLPLETEQTLSILKLLPDDVINSNARIASFISAAEEQLLLIERERTNGGDP